MNLHNPAFVLGLLSIWFCLVDLSEPFPSLVMPRLHSKYFRCFMYYFKDDNKIFFISPYFNICCRYYNLLCFIFPPILWSLAVLLKLQINTICIILILDKSYEIYLTFLHLFQWYIFYDNLIKTLMVIIDFLLIKITFC